MFLQHIRVFLVVGPERAWIESETEKLEKSINKTPNTTTRRTRILEYPEYLDTQNTDVERACLMRVLFIFKNFREECAESRAFGVMIIDGYIMGQEIIARLISYLNLSNEVDSIEQIICPDNFMQSVIPPIFLPYCGSYHYNPLDKKLSELISCHETDNSWLLIHASRHTHSLVLYSCASHEYLIVYSPLEMTKNGKSYKLLETTVAEFCGHDSILVLQEYGNSPGKFVCSQIYSNLRGILSRPKHEKISIHDIEINFQI